MPGAPADTSTGFLRPARQTQRLLNRFELNDTPFNVAIISFLLGALFATGAANGLRRPFVLGDQSWWGILSSPAFGVYLASWATFHLLEYLITAVYNPAQVNIDSFLLNNGRHYHIAHAFAIVEYLASSRYYPAEAASAKSTLAPLGMLMILAGQVLRSSAMATAAASFTHLIATTKRSEHILVTWGPYAYMRHPSYVAFFYWALGTQLILGNPIAFVGFALVMWKYFDARIKAEEKYLVSFFGDEYKEYRRRVATRLPFIA